MTASRIRLSSRKSISCMGEPDSARIMECRHSRSSSYVRLRLSDLFCIKRSQLLLVDLSDTCSGKLIHYPEAIELGVAGDFAASDGALDRGVDDFQSGNGICLRDYDGQWPLSPFWIWHQIGRASWRESGCRYV